MNFLIFGLFLTGTIFCEGAVEYVVVLGNEANQGYVDVFNGTTWYSLCYDGWDDEDAAVVCRMLGYTSNGAQALYDDSNITRHDIWENKLDCSGNETSLEECQISEANSTCVTSSPARVYCSKVPTPDDFFLLSFGSAIFRMDRASLSMTRIQTQVQQVIAVGYDDVFDMVIWTDIRSNQIAGCNINGGPITVIYQAGNESVMDGIAVDSDSRLIFYTDTGYDEIGVINGDTFVRNVIVDTALEEPRAIIFDSETREIFWTDWGDNAAIERASYDGSDREVLVNTGLVWPNSVVLDGDYLYWCDGSTGNFERMQRNGTDRRLITSLQIQCFDFAHFGSYFYCNGWTFTHLIQIAEDGSTASFIGPSLSLRRYGIHHFKKGVVNYFTVTGNEANWGYVDVYDGSEWYSLCYDGWDDEDAAVVCRSLGYTGDGAQALYNENDIQRRDIWGQKLDCTGSETSLKHCKTSEADTECTNSTSARVFCSKVPSPDDFFLISLGSTIVRMDRISESITFIQTGQRIISLGYDKTTQTVIWTDIILQQIARSDINGGPATVIYQAKNESVLDGIAVDSGSRLIFYTDAGYDEIGVIDADTFTRNVIIDTNLDEPRAITLDPGKREIFWTDWGANPAIERASYDGTGREVLVDSGLGWPNSVVLYEDYLYWCDAQTDLFEKIHKNGTGRTTILKIEGHCFDITIYGQFLYCTDWSYSQLIRIQKDGNSATLIGPLLGRAFGIHHFKTDSSVDMQFV